MKGKIDAPDYYPMSEAEKAHISEQIKKHWPTTKGYVAEDRARIETMQACYTLAKHRGAEAIKDLIEWMHK